MTAGSPEIPSAKINSWRRWRFRISLGVVATLLLAALAAFAWFFPQQVLTVDSGPVRVRAGQRTERKLSFQTEPENVRFPLLLG